MPNDSNPMALALSLTLIASIEFPQGPFRILVSVFRISAYYQHPQYNDQCALHSQPSPRKISDRGNRLRLALEALVVTV